MPGGIPAGCYPYSSTFSWIDTHEYPSYTPSILTICTCISVNCGLVQPHSQILPCFCYLQFEKVGFCLRAWLGQLSGPCFHSHGAGCGCQLLQSIINKMKRMVCVKEHFVASVLVVDVQSHTPVLKLSPFSFHTEELLSITSGPHGGGGSVKCQTCTQAVH